MSSRTVAALVIGTILWVGIGSRAALAQDDGGDLLTSAAYEYRRRIREGVRGFGDLRYDELPDFDRLFVANYAVSTAGGVSYDVSERFRIEGGLGFYYSAHDEVENRFETRLWQAATLDWPNSPGIFRRFVISHRFRLEERFAKTADWAFSLRLRYRIAYSYPINRYTVEPGAFYLPLKAEFFLPVSDDAEELFAQTARLTAGLGYVLDRIWRLELRYAWQRARDTVGADFRTRDQFIEFRIKSSLRIIDLLKSR